MAAIHKAARAGNVEKLRRLLAEGVSPDEITWGFGRTPLHWLCNPDTFNPVISVSPSEVSDFVTCFKLLREAGANLEAVDGWGYTPLQCAAYSEFPELLSLLVQARVNLDARSNVGTTALHRAARVSDKRAEDCVDVLLAGGASVNARDSSGETPLDVALSHHCRRVWPLLLRAGAEIPTNNTHPYIVRVRNAGSFKKYAQAHLARVAKTVESKLGLPARPARLVVEFWHHAGYY
mmetsp:Transcript_13777/g.42691  ORF Transcript_13777/g.42691 Transcript_13777/m.42691 type:complete len:235 (+) Transcript_13777:141-845(+)